MLGNWLKKLLREFVEKTLTQALFLKWIEAFFALAHKGTGMIPGTYDDEAFAKWEASVNKQEMSARMQQAILDLILPGLATRSMVGAPPAAATLADLESELPAIVGDVNQAIAA